MTQKVNPHWRRFGQHLRRLRAQAGLTQEQLAARLNLTPAMLSAMERGARGTKADYLDIIDAALNTNGHIHLLWNNASKQSAVPHWFENVASLQQQATELREHLLLLIPGFLQTREYAWTTLRYGDISATDAQIRQQVDERLKRQALLKGDEAPLFTAIINEAALRQQVGGHDVMSGQLDHLLHVSANARVTVQVVPMSTEHPPVLDEAFQLIKMPDLTQYAYTETRVSGSLIDAPDVVEVYTRLFGEVRGAALSPAASRDLIAQIQGEYR